jgi:dihydrofolate reductase
VVVYYVAASLDGFIAPPDRSLGWLAPFEGQAEDYGYAEFYASVDAVLLGRRTYEQCLTFDAWPYAGKPYWVFSRSTGHTPRGVLDELKARGLQRAWLVGGGELAGAFQAQGLISEYIISVIPVILGAGIALFGSHASLQALQLVDTKRYSSGIAQLRYLPAAVSRAK